MKPKNYILFSIVCLFFILFYAGTDHRNKELLKPLTNDHYNYIAINEILMWVSNNGDGSHSPLTDGNGFYWPGGKLAKKSAIFEDGLIWGGMVNGEIRVNGNTHRQGLQAGKIFSGGIADNPDNPRYRVYKIRKDWEDFPPGPERETLERDYNEWPVQDGAPWVDVNGDEVYSPGVDTPKFTGDEMLWYVANDMDSARAFYTYASDPIGLEFQTTIFGYNRTNDLADVVFKKYLIINKGSHTIEDMIFGYYSDADLGDAGDDFVGCDTSLNLGYCWNSDDDDGGGTGSTYGTPPPAVGYIFLQGPFFQSSVTDSARFNGKWLRGYKNHLMTSFSPNFKNNIWLVHDPPQATREGAEQYYNLLQGKNNHGEFWIDPYTGDSTIYPLSGDPVQGTGWYEGAGWPEGPSPADRRLLLASGPFTMAPGDSQEVIIAILIAMGEDHLDSITELKKKSQSVQTTYDLNFNIPPVMDKPVIAAVPADKSLTLYWETNAEAYNKLDLFLKNQGVSDSTYTFEGYRVWQFRDFNGTEPKLLVTYDIRNDVVEIYGRRTINGFPAQVVAIYGPNDGVRRSHTVTENSYDKKPLNNANPYYFAVTAYAYSEHSDPSYVESEPEIIEVIPGLQKIDETYPYDPGEKFIAEQISGNGDGLVELIVVDPDALTGDDYHVIFEGTEANLTFSLINYTINDTILDDCTDFSIDTVQAPVHDGFMLKLRNLGLDNLSWHNSAIKQVVELKGPGGAELEAPIDVFEHMNSTGEWEINSYGLRKDLKQEINMHDAAGYHSYEIRFTESGSEYYLTGSFFGFTPWRMDDPKAADKVPFEIWDVGRNDSIADDVRLTIKTLDDYFALLDDSNRVDQDGKWSQLENGDWEPIIAYFVDSTYSEPLPESSGRIVDVSRYKIGKIIISGELPAEGTVIRITTWKPLSEEDIFVVSTVKANKEDFVSAKDRLDLISVFPNPFFGFGTLSGYLKQDFIRFTNLPAQATIRIFSLAGIYVRRLEKNDENPWLDWDLKNNAGEQVSSGVYIAHLEMPNIGEKVMKLAIIQENQR